MTYYGNQEKKECFMAKCALGSRKPVKAHRMILLFPLQGEVWHFAPNGNFLYINIKMFTHGARHS